jgi:hypothetical protein
MTEAEWMPLFGDRDSRRIVAPPDEFEDLALAALFEMALELDVGLEVFDNVSITGSNSFGITFDEGSIRVPMPAARMTAFLTFIAVRLSGLVE